jgi:hypothetical protein
MDRPVPQQTAQKDLAGSRRYLQRLAGRAVAAAERPCQRIGRGRCRIQKQAYICAFTGDYQFWVNVLAFLLLQAFVSSRLIKYRGLHGVLLALPLVALGGYAIIAAGAGLSQR